MVTYTKCQVQVAGPLVKTLTKKGRK